MSFRVNGASCARTGNRPSQVPDDLVGRKAVGQACGARLESHAQPRIGVTINLCFYVNRHFAPPPSSSQLGPYRCSQSRTSQRLSESLAGAPRRVRPAVQECIWGSKSFRIGQVAFANWIASSCSHKLALKLRSEWQIVQCWKCGRRLRSQVLALKFRTREREKLISRLKVLTDAVRKSRRLSGVICLTAGPGLFRLSSWWSN